VKHAFALLIQIAVVILIFTLTWMTKDIGSLLPGSLGTERYEGFALTAQILIVDWLWNIVGPKLAALENHRTTMLQKRDEIMKTFYVKLINTFLPFMLIAFVKRFMESCEVDELNKESCLHEMQDDLLTFFFINILKEIGRLLLEIFRTKWNVSSELKSADKDARPTYLDVQCKFSEPVPISKEYMDLMIGFALILYFGQLAPIMAFFFLLANMLESRLLASRYSRVTQRAKPQRAEGIGPWLYIFEVITYTAAVFVPALSVFELHPLRDFPELSEFQMFIIFENVLVLLVVITHAQFGYQGPIDVRNAVKFQASYVDYLFSGTHASPIKVPDGQWQEVLREEGVPAIGPSTAREEIESREQEEYEEDEDDLEEEEEEMEKAMIR
jgi:hypothetical protein